MTNRLEYRYKEDGGETEGSIELSAAEAKLVKENPEALELLKRFGSVAAGGVELEVSVIESETDASSAMDHLPHNDVGGQTFVSIPIPPTIGSRRGRDVL